MSESVLHVRLYEENVTSRMGKLCDFPEIL